MDDGSQPHEHIVRVRARNPNPTLGLLTGEIAHNLRSALDCAIGELIQIGTGSPPPAKMNFEFPIFDNKDRFEKNHEKRIQGIPPGARAVIQAVQPFLTSPEIRSLWLLHKLDIENKHRALNVVGGGMLDLGIRVVGPGGSSGFTMPTDQPVQGFPIRDGATLFHFFSNQESPDMSLKIDRVWLGFTSPVEVYGFDVLNTMDHAVREVQAILSALRDSLAIPMNAKDIRIDVSMRGGGPRVYLPPNTDPDQTP